MENIRNDEVVGDMKIGIKLRNIYRYVGSVGDGLYLCTNRETIGGIDSIFTSSPGINVTGSKVGVSGLGIGRRLDGSGVFAVNSDGEVLDEIREDFTITVECKVLKTRYWVNGNISYIGFCSEASGWMSGYSLAVVGKEISGKWWNGKWWNGTQYLGSGNKELINVEGKYMFSETRNGIRVFDLMEAHEITEKTDKRYKVDVVGSLTRILIDEDVYFDIVSDRSNYEEVSGVFERRERRKRSSRGSIKEGIKDLLLEHGGNGWDLSAMLDVNCDFHYDTSGSMTGAGVGKVNTPMNEEYSKICSRYMIVEGEAGIKRYKHLWSRNWTEVKQSESSGVVWDKESGVVRGYEGIVRVMDIGKDFSEVEFV
jgi:hypothetical protein